MNYLGGTFTETYLSSVKTQAIKEASCVGGDFIERVAEVSRMELNSELDGDAMGSVVTSQLEGPPDRPRALVAPGVCLNFSAVFSTLRNITGGGLGARN